MNYYRCSTNEIHIEIQRRGYNVSGSRDQLSEILANDDNNRGTEATTVATRWAYLYRANSTFYVPASLGKQRQPGG
jgi:hypothetical protein